jgi:hypothetical protein
MSRVYCELIREFSLAATHAPRQQRIQTRLDGIVERRNPESLVPLG